MANKSKSYKLCFTTIIVLSLVFTMISISVVNAKCPCDKTEESYSLNSSSVIEPQTPACWHWNCEDIFPEANPSNLEMFSVMAPFSLRIGIKEPGDTDRDVVWYACDDPNAVFTPYDDYELLLKVQTEFPQSFLETRFGVSSPDACGTEFLSWLQGGQDQQNAKIIVNEDGWVKENIIWQNFVNYMAENFDNDQLIVPSSANIAVIYEIWDKSNMKEDESPPGNAGCQLEGDHDDGLLFRYTGGEFISLNHALEGWDAGAPDLTKLTGDCYIRAKFCYTYYTLDYDSGGNIVPNTFCGPWVDCCDGCPADDGQATYQTQAINYTRTEDACAVILQRPTVPARIRLSNYGDKHCIKDNQLDYCWPDPDTWKNDGRIDVNPMLLKTRYYIPPISNVLAPYDLGREDPVLKPCEPGDSDVFYSKCSGMSKSEWMREYSFEDRPPPLPEMTGLGGGCVYIEAQAFFDNFCTLGYNPGYYGRLSSVAEKELINDRIIGGVNCGAALITRNGVTAYFMVGMEHAIVEIPQYEIPIKKMRIKENQYNKIEYYNTLTFPRIQYYKKGASSWENEKYPGFVAKICYWKLEGTPFLRHDVEDGGGFKLCIPVRDAALIFGSTYAYNTWDKMFNGYEIDSNDCWEDVDGSIANPNGPLCHNDFSRFARVGVIIYDQRVNDNGKSGENKNDPFLSFTTDIDPTRMNLLSLRSNKVSFQHTNSQGESKTYANMSYLWINEIYSASAFPCKNSNMGDDNRYTSAIDLENNTPIGYDGRPILIRVGPCGGLPRTLQYIHELWGKLGISNTTRMTQLRTPNLNYYISPSTPYSTHLYGGALDLSFKATRLKTDAIYYPTKAMHALMVDSIPEAVDFHSVTIEENVYFVPYDKRGNGFDGLSLYGLFMHEPSTHEWYQGNRHPYYRACEENDDGFNSCVINKNTGFYHDVPTSRTVMDFPGDVYQLERMPVFPPYTTDPGQWIHMDVGENSTNTTRQ